MRRLVFRCVVAALALVLVAGLEAIFVYQEVRKVPVARLAANLETRLASDPRNIEVRLNLARLYGMAYALRSDEVPSAARRNDVEEPWYGYDHPNIPYKSKPLGAGETAARVHLDTAGMHYVGALKLDPDNLLARLGYGWVLEQSGEKAAAIEEYRAVITRAWPKETKASRTGRPYFTEEAAGYLIPLLDPQRDGAEIRTLKERRAELRGRPRPITPIALPLREGMTLHDIVDDTAAVRFDADGTGITRRWTWISRDAGWLVYDHDSRGEITSALQWFGSVSFWLFWENGYHALAALDDSGDGELTGAELRGVAIWQDANQNGSSERGEVRSLASFGIVALSTRYADGDGLRVAAESRAGARLTDGRWIPTYDIILRSARETTN